MTVEIRVIVAALVFWLSWRLLRSLVSGRSLDNVAGPPSKSFWKGNFKELFSPDGWAFHDAIAKQYGGVVKINALLGDKMLYVFDPKALHHIVVKDQDIFQPSAQFTEMTRVLFGEGLLSTVGNHHRKQRKMLNPVFSIAHMRNMVPTFYKVTHKLRATLISQLQDGSKEINMLQWISRVALELIGQGGLGHSFDPLTGDLPSDAYAKTMKETVATLFQMFFVRNYVLPWAVKIGPRGFRRFMVQIIPWKNLHTAQKMSDIMYKTSTDIYNGKKRALAEGDESVSRQIGQGKDIISVLMQENMKAANEDRLDDTELIGQMTTLTFAAMDTTSGALCRVLHLLAEHPDVQTKLRQEIVAARTLHGEPEYDELVALPYLDAVCRETLRLYPPITQVMRTAQKDTVLPLSVPVIGNDGREIHKVMVPRYTNVMVAVRAANRNPNVWGPDASEWKPERWLSPLPSSVAEAHTPGIYSNLMTFFGGGRACIGFKFSQLEMKVVLSVLLEVFQFSLPEKEIHWEMISISAPIVKDAGDRLHRMPLKVSLVPKMAASVS